MENIDIDLRKIANDIFRDEIKFKYDRYFYKEVPDDICNRYYELIAQLRENIYKSLSNLILTVRDSSLNDYCIDTFVRNLRMKAAALSFVYNDGITNTDHRWRERWFYVLNKSIVRDWGRGGQEEAKDRTIKAIEECESGECDTYNTVDEAMDAFIKIASDEETDER